MKRILLLLSVLFLFTTLFYESDFHRAETVLYDTGSPAGLCEQAKAAALKAMAPSIRYVKALKSFDPKSELLYGAMGDIDGDGNDETVLTFGQKGDYDEESQVTAENYIDSFYILRSVNAQLVLLSDEIPDSGYTIYGVRLVRLQGEEQGCLACSLTNYVNLHGFSLYALKNNELNQICYSASATGAGYDELIDANSDGSYDSYVQHRWSYDVLYYQVSSTYVYKAGKFSLSSSTVEVPEYPSDIEDVLYQFMSLHELRYLKSSEIDQRLTELCTYEKADGLDFGFSALHASYIMDKFVYSVQIIGNHAKASVSYTDWDDNQYSNNFTLARTNGRWVIDFVSNGVR